MKKIVGAYIYNKETSEAPHMCQYSENCVWE